MTTLKEKSNGKASVELSTLKKDTELTLWLEVNFPKLDSIVGSRGIHLFYLTWEKDVPTELGPDLLDDKPYIEEHVSVEIFLIIRETHNHPLMKQYDHKLFELLVKSWSGTGINSCITGNRKSFKEGRKLFLQAVKELSGKERMKKMIWDNEDILTKSKFSDAGKNKLNQQVGIHWPAFGKLEVAERIIHAN